MSAALESTTATQPEVEPSLVLTVRVFDDGGIRKVEPTDLTVPFGYDNVIVWTIDVDKFQDIHFADSDAPFTDPCLSADGKVFTWHANNSDPANTGKPFHYVIEFQSNHGPIIDPTVENEPPPVDGKAASRKR